MKEDRLYKLVDKFSNLVLLYLENGYLDLDTQIKLFKTYIDIRIGLQTLIEDMLRSLKEDIEKSKNKVDILGKIYTYLDTLTEIQRILSTVENTLSRVLGRVSIYKVEESGDYLN